MFDTHSDYALNKMNKNAIICPCASGEHIRLVREDFSSEEEFLRWKKWSDENYHEAELASRNDGDCLSFEEFLDTPAPSAEETVLTSYVAIKLAEKRKKVLEQIKDKLTRKQFRRLWMFHVQNLSIEEIAAAEKVSVRAIYTCFRMARARL